MELWVGRNLAKSIFGWSYGALCDCLFGEFFVIGGHCLHPSYRGSLRPCVSWATRCYCSLQGITAFCAELACKQRVCRLCSQQALRENAQDLGWGGRKLPAGQKQTRWMFWKMKCFWAQMSDVDSIKGTWAK